MKLTGASLLAYVRHAVAGLRPNDLSSAVLLAEAPLRSELLSAEQLEQRGRYIAGTHTVSQRPATDKLLPRLTANEDILRGAFDQLTEAVAADRRVTPASEWLLDNFYLIEEQIRTARRHLPRDYSRELPQLADGPCAGFPRVYDVALETIAHGDGRVDLERLKRFIAGYESVTALNLGELWAIPIMLRLALIENLRRVALRITAGRIDRDLAEVWARRMITTVEHDPKDLILVIADMARSDPPMTAPFVSEFVRLLQGQGPVLGLALSWIEQRLVEPGFTTDLLIQAGNQNQAADQVTIGNSIGSLRFLASVDWRRFVESVSEVDQVLRSDPASAYAEMDFATRNRYRQAIERIAKRSRLSERQIAEGSIRLASEAAARAQADDVESTRRTHVGYYLIDRGLRELERLARFHRPVPEVVRDTLGQAPLLVYLGAIALITILTSAVLLPAAGDASGWRLAIYVAAVVLAMSQLAVALVNWLVMLLVAPRALPRMDFSTSIPPTSSTLVVVPTFLTTIEGVDDLVEALEVRFLANRDSSLRFGLLTDFPDADAELLPTDDALLRHAAMRVESLNAQYGDDTFYLFHRPRRWNAGERVWMGYERKRGKLADLNWLLREGASKSAAERFSLVVGNIEPLANTRYVITLDTDTQLPRDAARELVGTMAHPLNRPGYDPSRQRVCKGYGILQPRVSPSLPGASRSVYARLYSGDSGIDPYTRTVSDVYQDWVGEGSFIGKGIYDVDAFEQSLNGRFPENRILSHDLLEGCYARSGLISDVEVFEDHPASYLTDLSRRHRWIRGDWQIASWLLPWVPVSHGRLQRNPLSALSLWKIADNLRRSLVPVALLLLLLAGWLTLPSPKLWTLVVVVVVFAPAFLGLMQQLFRKPPDSLLRLHIAVTLRSAVVRCAQAVVALACLPHEAFVNADAVLRTTWRMLVSHRRRLAWSPFGAQSQGSALSLLASFRAMWGAPTAAMATMAGLAVSRPATLLWAAPVLALWLLAPGITWWLSRPLVLREPRLKPSQEIFLRTLARRTWAYFETFVGPEDNWLPPDNFQELPVPNVAHRTSPTNMGLALLANVTAYDFGYLTAGGLLERTSNAFRSMSSLERHRGHFYNWYDTRTLQPLLPMYVSTVDSGNLASYVLTLRAALLALPDDPILSRRTLAGLADTLDVLQSSVGTDAGAALAAIRHEIDPGAIAGPMPLRDAKRRLDRLVTLAGTLSIPDAGNGVRSTAADAARTQDWAAMLLRQCQVSRDELVSLAPWLSLPAAPTGLEALLPDTRTPSLREVADLESKLSPDITRALETCADAAIREWLIALRESVTAGSAVARQAIENSERLGGEAGEFANVDHAFLYDRSRRLFRIGFNVSDRRLDSSYYDLLASEARLCSFLAIAQGALPQESWFALGRMLAIAGGEPVLVSWSGSMFEYLMPQLVMPSYPNTLLDQTSRAAVQRQIDYGRQRGVPWGISESGYNFVDANRTYQYRAFGVPGLGLQRGLGDDLVIAPYASALALMVEPEAACSNLERLAAAGLLGRFGMFEAIDYTPSRLPRGQTGAIVHSYMAHHQAMSLLAFADLLLDHALQTRFASDPAFKATLTLLHERIPRSAAVHAHPAALPGTPVIAEQPLAATRVITSPDTPAPEVQLLSNGRYHVMVTGAGGGYSRWKDLAVTRWQEDPTRDHWGSFCYIRDLASGEFWSNASQPAPRRPDHYEAIFTEGRAEFHRQDRIDGALIETRTEMVVSPEDDIELRRIRIINRSRTRRALDLTTYAEVVMAPAAADALHPAFSKLFVQTEILRQKRALLCTRRPRSLDEQPGWMFHLATISGGIPGELSFETDRATFIGRGRTAANPRALATNEPLSGSEGPVLDPIVAIQQQIVLDPDRSVTIDVVTGVAPTRESAEQLIDRYQDRHLADRVFGLAWTHNQVVLRQLDITESDAQVYQRLAGSVIHANASLRADASTVLRNRRGQSSLWGYAISGDLPIVLLQIADRENMQLVRQMLQARAYWRLKGLVADLVIWNEEHAGYRQQLHDEVMGLVAGEASVIDRPGGIFVRAADHITPEDRVLLQAVARVVIVDKRGTLAEQVKRRMPSVVPLPLLATTKRRPPDDPVPAAAPRADLILTNGAGGFTPDGREYVITLESGQSTPAPWVNVIANPQFGTVVSESGSAYTWSENAHEFRLTPWHNDPITDESGEAFYLRDEVSGRFWSPTPGPVPGRRPYVSRHGFGYSVFEHEAAGIRSELIVHVATDAAVKFWVLNVRNESGELRKLSATGYIEWVLGDLRAKSAMHVSTEIDPKTAALFARNPYNAEFPDRIAFFDVDDQGAGRTVTGDRAEFLGRNGTTQRPAAMARARLSGRVGAMLDPCAAIQVTFELGPGQERQLVFRMGVGAGLDETRALVTRFRGPAASRAALESVWEYWKRTLGAVQVETPDESLNVLVNGWLLYQTLSCRFWARSGFYQSGGAFGFRDQLQDVMALIHAEARLTRAHLLFCASRQFVEGDVQHWWHPPAGRGVRTRFSDDYLWLPLATCRYVFAIGDTGVLDETVPFLEGRAVHPDDESYYDLPGRAGDSASLYQHCVRALRHGFRFGSHGLPLMGSGDWNDGMNKVGIHGKGESVWLGFFLYEVLQQFSRLARMHDDAAFAEECDAVRVRLRESIETHGWDGQWYRRAYFDDGTPLGSATNPECRIDSISQSWSVLSGAGDAKRARRAMEALDSHLVRRDDSLIQLLDPPFDQSSLDPGYIRGYVPGVRENGGQYTHAAIWASMAFAELGDARRAWELLTMINPVNHTLSAQDAAIYKVEPYVVAADVYASPPHVGRGGWTWYTGSAGWLYRLIVESLLGLRLDVDKLRFKPCLPAHWRSFKLHYRYRRTTYHILVTQRPAPGEEDAGQVTVTVDGMPRRDEAVPLINDRIDHTVEVSILTAPTAGIERELASGATTA